MTRKYKGTDYKLFQDMSQQKHLMIAGSTGSGKSVLLNGIIHSLLFKSQKQAQFIFIDLKKVELIQYDKLPHTIAYADTIEDAIKALNRALAICDHRYKQMQRKRLKLYSGTDLYIGIDEFAELATNSHKKEILQAVQRLAQIGRAAKIHIILCTQCPLSSVIPTSIKVNFDSKVGLHTVTKQDSRNILGFTGCELLPQYGQCLYLSGGTVAKYNIPYITDAEIERIVKYWT